MGRLVVVLLLASCGRIGFDAQFDGGSELDDVPGSDGAGGGDGGDVPAAPSCAGLPATMRVGNRDDGTTTFRNYHVGFRCARPL